MKRLLLIFLLFAQVITATNCEDLENAITKSDKDAVVKLLQNTTQLKEMEVIRLIDLAQQIIITRKGERECFMINPDGYGSNHKERRMHNAGLIGFAISLVSGLAVGSPIESDNVKVTCGVLSFISFSASLFLLFRSINMCTRRWSRELQKSLDNSIQIKSLLWKYYNSLQEA